jgi:pyrroloquinoline quinone (PQQ) biosynthesis protein C
MTFLKNLSPIRAIRDLRFFLAQRKPHELWFMMLSMGLTLLVLWAFVKDSHIEAPYKRNIIYVESWPLTRTDDQIRAQQKIDQAKKHIAEEELEKRRKAKQAEFKKVDDWLTNHGF